MFVHVVTQTETDHYTLIEQPAHFVLLEIGIANELWNNEGQLFIAITSVDRMDLLIVCWLKYYACCTGYS